ncbi:hypothetical protein OWV82_006325 [Melia azedarach]|uniref:Uncharacterized protein n=1 Tax=Melia azedarach TaxID=155640 RepID=A0ACC1YHK9_MELAZ|nr:hypothetical protein OWV82_006325 [Melia azedarach]
MPRSNLPCPKSSTIIYRSFFHTPTVITSRSELPSTNISVPGSAANPDGFRALWQCIHDVNLGKMIAVYFNCIADAEAEAGSNENKQKKVTQSSHFLQIMLSMDFRSLGRYLLDDGFF